MLYTEMVTTGALIHGPRERLLAHNEEHPVAFQLGGSNPEDLAKCASFIEDCGYNEVNLNVGCPSNRVQSGRFGACLMAEPALVAECVSAMKENTKLPVTIKCRLGIDQLDQYEHLSHFISEVASAGCNLFIIHARKAWLNGLSPKENREIPPLNYDRVFQIKADFPALDIILNGGIKSIKDCLMLLNHVDGIMMGREAYQNPGILLDVDETLFTSTSTTTETACAHQQLQTSLAKRIKIAALMGDYIEKELDKGTPIKSITRHTLGLFNQLPGARSFRRVLSEPAKGASGIDTWYTALSCIAGTSEFKL